MPLVDSEKFWTKGLKIFAVVQFPFYMFMFWLYYKIEPTGSPATWRVVTLVAVAAGLVTSCWPAFARDNPAYSKQDNEFNPTYLSVIYPFIFFAIQKVAVSYYYWSFSFSMSDLATLCLFYLIVAPIAGFFHAWMYDRVF